MDSTAIRKVDLLGNLRIYACFQLPEALYVRAQAPKEELAIYLIGDDSARIICFSKTTSCPPSLPKMKIITHATSLQSSTIWDPSSIDLNKVSMNPFLFCQLILRAFIESLYLIACTRTFGVQSSLRSLTYHRSLVVDWSTSNPIVKDRCRGSSV